MISHTSSLLGFFFYIKDIDRQHLATAIWLFALGVALGALVVALIWGVLRLAAPKLGRRCSDAFMGPVLFPVSIVLGIWILIAGAIYPMVMQPLEILRSVQQFPTTGTNTYEKVIPIASGEVDQYGLLPAHSLDIVLPSDQIRKIDITSSGKIEFAMRIVGADLDSIQYDIGGGEPFQWKRGESETIVRKIPRGEIVELLVRNGTNSEIELSITLLTEPEHVEVGSIFYIAGLVIGFYAIYFLMACAFPKMTAIAEATVRSELFQVLFLICAVIGCLFMIASIYIPYQTFGEDIKILKHTCLQAMLVLGMVIAIWAASRSISEEIDGKTALTLLSKPVSRRQFVLGKFIGIAWLVSILFVIVSSFFIVSVAEKPIFDRREGASQQFEGEQNITWQLLHHEAITVAPGVLLVYMETLVLVGVSVAISTRLPLVANFMLTFGIWAMGHLTPSIVRASAEGFEPVQFVASFLATILPVLENFEIYGPISAGREIPMEYLGAAALYTLLYGALTMLLALILFEDRDLA